MSRIPSPRRGGSAAGCGLLEEVRGAGAKGLRAGLGGDVRGKHHNGDGAPSPSPPPSHPYAPYPQRAVSCCVLLGFQSSKPVDFFGALDQVRLAIVHSPVYCPVLGLLWHPPPLRGKVLATCAGFPLGPLGNSPRPPPPAGQVLSDARGLGVIFPFCVDMDVPVSGWVGECMLMVVAG